MSRQRAGAAGAALAFLAVLALTRTGPVRAADLAVAAAGNRLLLRRPGLADAFLVVQWVTQPVWLRAAAVLAAAVLALRRRRRVALWLLATTAAAFVVELALKAWVARPRPVFAHPVTVLGGWSFPSGHALTWTVALGVGLLLVPRTAARWAAAAALELLVGLDRVVLGAHYVTDVLGGWCAGLAVVLLAASFLVHLDDRPAEP